MSKINKKYTKANGYLKFYNAAGISCRVKFADTPKEERSIFLKFKNNNETKWLYLAPNGKFSSESQVLHYILKNLQNPNIVFKIVFQDGA